MTRSQEIYSLLRARISSGRLAPGSRLPAEPELAAELKVARRTLRSALALLQKEGLICRTPHKGTFVRDFSGSTEKRITNIINDSNEVPTASKNKIIYLKNLI